VLRIPPLRDRSEDIPLLVDYYREKWGKHHGRTPRRFSPGALDALIRHGWPGNVRELEHLVEMLTLMVEGEEVALDDLPGAFTKGSRREAVPSPEGKPPSEPLPEAVARFERDMVAVAISRAGGVKARAARSLGIDTNQMRYLCRKYVF
jgi:DNA-binding NtrC family response regulator